MLVRNITMVSVDIVQIVIVFCNRPRHHRGLNLAIKGGCHTVGRDGDKIWRPKAGLGNNADMSLGHVRGWEDAMQREKNAKFHLLGEKQKNQFVAKGRGMAV